MLAGKTAWQCRLRYHTLKRFGNNYRQGERTRIDLSRVLVGKTDAGSVCLGDYVICAGELYSFLGQGKISIGDCSYVGLNTRIWSLTTVTVGQRVLIAHDVFIVDNLTHPLDAKSRHRQYMAKHGFPFPDALELDGQPITIEDDVWVGAGAIVLRGVCIGAGSVVAAGSVVTKSVPRGVIVAGNPASVVKEIV